MHRMHIAKVLLLLSASCLLHGATGDDFSDLLKEQDADILAEKNAAAGSQHGLHIGEVDVQDGEETEQQPAKQDDPHGNAMELIVQELEDEVNAEGEFVHGNINDELELVAEQFLEDSEGPPSIHHTILELPHDTDIGGWKQKRQAYPLSSRWEKGIIPYSFTDVRSGEKAESAKGQENIIKAMKFLETTTCLRFPKMSATVHADNGLPHKNFLRFIVPDGGGCWSFVGRGRGTGQAISCCGGFGVCLHELGHALGYLHEQDRANRDLYVAMHPENANQKYRWVFNQPPYTKGVNIHPYDLGSNMHYSAYGFSINGLPTLSVKDKSLAFLLGNTEGSISHYDLMGTTNYYECTAKCTDAQKAVKCQNDGFLDVNCKCKCSQLFAGDQCEAIYKPSAEPTSWPVGSYGLPDSIMGCPKGSFSVGSRTHATQSGSYQQNGGKLKPFDGNLVVDNFCMRTDATSGSGDWPAGTYCIYQQGDTCPTGFKSGWILFDDDNARSSLNTVDGSVPKGTFNKDTKYFYCCRDDSSSSTPIVLPKAKAFQLLRFGGSCQAVKGMLNMAYHVRIGQATKSSIQSQDPSPSYSNWWGDVWLYYCYYVPVNYDDCGGIIELTDASPSTTIQSPNYPKNYDNLKKCTWLIKAPEGKHLALDFNDFDIQDDSNNKCKDTVEVRHSLIGQPGQKGFAIIILETDITETRKGFNATARIIMMLMLSDGATAVNLPNYTLAQDATGYNCTAAAQHPADAEQCISTKDNGQSYRGAVSYTQHYHKCLSWEETKHCSVNPLSKNYMHSGLVGNNNCRNPNALLRPWCYTNKYCEFDFCDVCGVAKCYDYFDDCAELTGKDDKYCITEEAFHGCHKTCNFCGKDQDKTVSSCPAPVVKDKNAAIEKDKSSQKTFKFGEKVKLVCKDKVDGIPVTSELTCLTDGTYDGTEMFCGRACPDGWHQYQENCYKLVKQKAFYPAAIAGCKAENSHITSIRNTGENEFVNTLVGGKEIYIGFNDAERTGTWHWEDGFTGNYSNWKPKQPSGGYWDKCGSMKDGLWNDIYCDIHYPQMYVCKKKFSGFDSDYYCVDEDPTCHALIGRNYKVCKENREFSNAHCRRSCGFCPVSECPSPYLVDNTVLITPHDYVQSGNFFEYRCSAGYELFAGTLGRTCVREGILSGTPPVCKPEAEFEDTYGQRVFARSRTEKADKLSIYDSAESNIKRNGKALRWVVYSSIHTTLMAQVWRRINGTKFLLVGQSMLNLRPKRVNTYNLKSFEGFMVQNGDLLGWFTPPGKQGLTYSDCGDSFANRTLYQMDFENLGEVNVGMQKTIALLDKCRTYSIALTVGGGAVGSYVNVAAASRGATCSAVSSGQELCGMAIDGGLAPFNNAWMSNNEGVGAFITITFDETYPLIGARFMQRLSKTGQIQKIKMTFSDGSSQMAGLSERKGTSAIDMSAARWDAFDLTPVSSSFVTVTVDSVYSTDYNGFIEVEFYAGCATGWTHFSGSCYKYGLTKTLGWPDIIKLCTAEKAGMVHINSAEENAFVKNMITGNTWIGANDRDTEGTWVWSDGVSSTYTNWDKDRKEPNNYGGYEHCAQMSTSGMWYDAYCGWTRQYVCEKPLDKVQKKPSMISVGSLVQPRKYLAANKRLHISNRTETLFTKAGTVTGWKIYGRKDSTLVLSVWRRIAGSTDKFTLVGSNSAQTKQGWVTFVNVPLLWQIKVQPGDVIGMQFPDGETGTVYDICNNNKVKMTSFEKKWGWTNPERGQEVTFDSLSSYYPCREFSIVAMMVEEVKDIPNVVNIGATSMGATCEASDNGDDCVKVIDGDTAPSSEWKVTASPVAGNSLKVMFKESYGVQFISIMQRFGATGQTKTVTLEFSDGTTQEVVLKQRLSGSFTESRNGFWDDFEITKVDTTFIKFTIKDLYTESQNGFVEIKVFAGCATGYTRFRDHCYLLKKDKIKYFPANKVCKAAGEKLVRVDDAAENEFLKKLAGGEKLWIGFRDDYKGIPDGVWSWEEDSKAYTYKNWAAGNPSGRGRWGYCATLDSDGLWRDHYCKWYNKYWFVCEKNAPGTAAAAAKRSLDTTGKNIRLEVRDDVPPHRDDDSDNDIRLEVRDDVPPHREDDSDNDIRLEVRDEVPPHREDDSDKDMLREVGPVSLTSGKKHHSGRLTRIEERAAKPILHFA